MSINRLTIRQLRVFLTVADQLSFSAAAEHLRVAQSSISVTIRDVESQLAVQLFHRDTRNVRLTEAGENLVGLARRILQTQEGAAREFESYLAGDRGQLTVSSLPSVAAVTLPDLVRRFTRQFPGIQLHLHDDISTVVVESVLSGAADLGIAAPTRLPPGLTGRELMNSPLVAVLPAGHRLAKSATLTWSELAAEPFVTIDQGSVQPLIEKAFATVDREISTYAATSSIQSIAGLVAAGMGVSALPAQAVPMLAFSHVVTRPLVEPQISQKVMIVWRSEGDLSAPARKFVEHLLASVDEVPTRDRKSRS